MNKNLQISKQYVRALIDTAKIDKAKKQFEVVFATETPVFRRHWEESFYEILSCSKEHMRTERMDGGVVPLLDNHDTYSGISKQYGSLISYDVVNGECRGLIQFSTRSELQGYWDDIEAGIIRGISARYIPWVYQRELVHDRTEPNYRAIDWEVTEISLAPVPADYNSKVRGEANDVETFEITINNFNNETNTRSKMDKEKTEVVEQVKPTTPATQTRSEETPTASAQKQLDESQIRAAAQTEERGRITGIRTAVRTAGLEDTFADELIVNGTGIDDARASIFEKMAEKNTPNVRTQGNATLPLAIGDESTHIRAAMQEAILHRAEPGAVKLSEKAQDFKGMKLMDMARHMMHLKGENPFRLNQNEMIARAISLTDFPDLLTSTVGRQLRKYFEAFNSGSWKKIANATSVSDFRAKTGVQVDGAVTFEKIAEGGEYKSAKFLQNSKATISVDTYGKLIKITRQAIINDDLGVFTRVPKMIAQGASNMQAKMVWDLVLENSKTPDGVTLFHADHANLAGAGTAITEASLNAAMLAIMKQQSTAKEELMLQPKYLIVPAEKQVEAQKILTAVIANATGDVNVFASAYELISEIRLSRKSATAWYMAADPASVEGLLYAYLDGEEGIYTESRTNFEDDSVETKARLDFGVSTWDYRGWYKNPGA